MAPSDARKLHIDIPLVKSGSSQPCPPCRNRTKWAHSFKERRRHGLASYAPFSLRSMLGLKDGMEVDVEVGGDRGSFSKGVG